MKILLRIEVLFLLTVGAVGAVWVLFSDKPDTLDPAHAVVVSASKDPGDGKTLIRGCHLERDFGNARLDIELRVTNSHSKKLLLAPPDLRLINAKGDDVPAFFLPTEPPPELMPKSTNEVRMRFWLEGSDLMGPLTIEVEGAKFPIKSAAALDIETLKNAEAKEMPVGGDWVGTEKKP